jgi:ComF family protein
MPNTRSGTNLIYTFLLDIFFPPKCLNCGKYGEIVCFDCAKEISLIQTLTCPECGRVSQNGKYCQSCKSAHKNIALKGIVIGAHYDSGPLKEMIHHFKYSGYLSLSEQLAEIICSRLTNINGLKNFVVVPVPLHLSRKNRRGYNQSELLARYISAHFDMPGGDALVRMRDTKPQIGLPRAKRLENLEDAFSCQDTELITDRKILLIDDVTTTGATLNECAKALKNAGAKEIWGAVVARNI